MKITGLLLVILLGLAGCTTADLVFDTQSDLRSYKQIYVETSLNDSSHLDQLIANELVRLGYNATAGVRTMMPTEAKLFITYESQWNWDFRTYLMVLEINVRDVSSEKHMGHARIFHSGVTTKTPEKMVAELLKPLFGPKTEKNNAPRIWSTTESHSERNETVCWQGGIATSAPALAADPATVQMPAGMR